MRHVIAVLARIKMLLAGLAAIGFSATASAGSVTAAPISQLQIATNATGVFVEFSVAKTSNPACNTNTNWKFFLPLTTTLENQMLALIVAARTTNAPITLIGSGLCDQASGVETLEYVLF